MRRGSAGTGDARGTGGGRWRRTGAAETLTRGSRRHRAWTARRLALGACCGRRAGAPLATRGAGEVEREARSARGELGREGSRTAATKIGRRPHGHAHAGPGMSRVCQYRYWHLSLSSVIQKGWGLRHCAPKIKISNFADQAFCKFESWSDQKFQKTVLVKKEGIGRAHV